MGPSLLDLVDQDYGPLLEAGALNLSPNAGGGLNDGERIVEVDLEDRTEVGTDVDVPRERRDDDARAVPVASERDFGARLEHGVGLICTCPKQGDPQQNDGDGVFSEHDFSSS